MGYAVPVRRDRDGDPLVLCYWDSQAGTGPAEYWAIWCSTCAEVVSPPLEGSLGLADLDGAPESQADIVLRDEQRMSDAHAAAMGWTGGARPGWRRIHPGARRTPRADEALV